MAASQGTILEFAYNGRVFGSGYPYDSSTGNAVVDYVNSDSFAKLKANAFIGTASVLFVGTFLAFAIARASARALDRKDKTQVLLSDYHHHDPHESKSKKSYSRSKSSRGERERRSSKTPVSSTSKSASPPRSRSRSRREMEEEEDERRSSSRRRSGKSSSRTGEDEAQRERRSSSREGVGSSSDYRRYDDDF